MTDNILDFISKTFSQYMTDNSLCFTDFEKAGLIYNSPLLPEERLRRLEVLASETADECLKGQIATRLQVERERIAAFKKNNEGYVYVVNSYEYGDNCEPFTCGYFAYFDLAYEHGKKQGKKFDIEKYRIVGHNGMQPLKSKVYLEPIAEPMEVEDNIHCSDGRFQYDKNGTLIYYHCAYELGDCKESISFLFDTNRFENAFIFMPNPFELGDIVKDTEYGNVGIVGISQKDQNSFYERIRSGELTGVDFFDSFIIVDFLCNDGTFSHGHINPAFLEKYEPETSSDDYMVLTAASELRRGNGSLEHFTNVCENYRYRQEKRR